MRLIVVVPALAGDFRFLQPHGVLGVFHVSVAENDVLPFIVARRQFREKVDREDVIEVIVRSEEHTSELQSQSNLVCRLLLEKKNYLYEVSDYSAPHGNPAD